VFSDDLLVESIGLARELREQGFDVILAEPDKLSKQFKLADRLGVKFALVLGPDELDNDLVGVKDLRTFEQESISRSELKSIFNKQK
ncbi:MAG: histidine--tRNA ligase, partial [Chloroflexi bacterium]|nr:histidine--tRNA ligase [Chloroflexota bacterium]